MRFESWMMSIKVLFDRPSAELIVKYISTVIAVNFLEDNLRILNVNSPLIQHWNCCLELDFTYPSILAGINSIKGSPIFVILPQIKYQIFELGLRNVVISMRVLRFQFIFSSVECSYDDGFEMEELRQLDYISYALINFSKAQIAVAVDIDEFPVFITLFNVIFSVPCWQFRRNFFPNLIRHLNNTII
jgi:hypothetical protein